MPHHCWQSQGGSANFPGPAQLEKESDTDADLPIRLYQ